MLLTIDIGNSHSVAGIFTGDKLQHSWRWRTEAGATADELACLLANLFSLADINPKDISGVAMASVVPPLNQAMTTCCAGLFGLTPLVVSAATDTGITVATDNPNEVGADRLVNSVAAYTRYHCDLIVVDFGTATTFDCVSAAGEYLGGAIAPGLGISLEALRARTAKLPRVDISRPPETALGKSTETAIASGVIYGYAGLVQGLLQRLGQEMNSRPRVIATGGLAALIAAHVPEIEATDPLLTLDGLRIIHARNC